MTSDAVYDFALTCLEYPSNGRESNIESLREGYQEWARRVGRREEIAERTLSSRLAKIDGLRKRKTNKGARWNCAIKAIKDWDEPMN